MLYFLLKAGLSGILIAIISEAARRYPGFGGLIASLPLISVLAIIWLWRDTAGDTEQVAAHAKATLWYVIPSLPFFLVLPALLQKETGFWLSLLIASGITVILYFIAILVAGQFGITFLER
jgi:F0F1-type ATP synthase assembly protein I